MSDASGGTEEIIEHRLWVDRLIPNDATWLGTALSVSLLTYALPMLAAALGGWWRVYVTSTGFIVGALGVGWVTASVRNRSQRVDGVYSSLENYFDCDPRELRRFVNTEFRRIVSVRRHALLSAAIAGFGITIATLQFFGAWQPIAPGTSALRSYVLATASVRGPALVDKYIVFVFFATLVGTCVGTSLWLIGRELLLVWRLRRFLPVPLAEVVRTGLRPLADFHVRVATYWAVGAVAFAYLFGLHAGRYASAALVGLVIISMLTFLLSQLILSRIVRNAHDRACALARSGWKVGEAITAQDLAALTQISTRPKFGVYSIDDLLRWAGAEGIAITAVVLQLRTK